MNNFALEIWDDESRYVTFYTVRRENETDSETDKFYTRFKDDPIYRPALEELTALIFDIIGDREGALDAFFRRQENKAAALPPAKLKSLSLEYPNFPLRLFCFKVSERIVILFNGGPKTAGTSQSSERLNFYFQNAQNFASRISDALRDGDIQIDKKNNRYLIDFKNSRKIFL
jgi:hypothetical protein